MNSAKAAAAASTPSIKGGIYLDSFDARIIEYQYAVWKIQLLITHLKALAIKIRSSPDLIPLLHYIETIASPLVTINDTLNRRFESIVTLVPLTDQRKVIPPVNTFPINFELPDTECSKTNYSGDHDYKLLLEQLQSVLENTLQVYQKKLAQSLIERKANRIPEGHSVPPPLDLSVFKDILQSNEILSLFKYVIEKNQLETYTWSKAKDFVEAIERSVLELKTYIQKLKEYKLKPVDGSLKKLKDWQYTIHKIFAIVVRLSDLYTILRKFGRELYLPSFNELHNPKLLHNNIKLEVALKNADEFLKSNKKNQQLVYLLVKATHQGSYFHLKQSNVLEFANSAIQGYDVVLKNVEDLLNLIKTWDQVKKERPVRQAVSRSPSTSRRKQVPEVKRLEVLFNPEKDKLSQEVIAKQQREREKVATVEREVKEKQLKERQFIDDLNNRRKVEERERQLRDGLKDSPTSPLSRNSSFRAPPVSGSRNRSGSNASATSTSSNSSALNSMRTNSLTNTKPKIPSPTITRSPSLQRRPASVYMSSPAFDIRSELRRQEKARLAAASSSPLSSISSPNNTSNILPQQVITRKRSSSLQSQNSSISVERNNNYIAAAANAALKQERSSSLQTKAEVIQYRHAIQRREQLLSVNQVETSRSRSPSPLRSKSSNIELPDISELGLNDIPETTERSSVSNGSDSPQAYVSPRSILKASKPARTRSRSSSLSNTPVKSPGVSDSTQVTPVKAAPIKQGYSTPINNNRTPPNLNVTTPTITLDPGTSDKVAERSSSEKPVLKIIPPTSSLDPPAVLPELINETTSESSMSITEEQITSVLKDDSPKSLETLEQGETQLPKPIIKKVRFIGVPDEIEEDRKPKKKGWYKPPRLMSTAFSSHNANRTSLSFAADALQQESITFHNIRKGELTDNAGNLKNQRLTGSLAVNNSNKGKWKSFRDRFS